MKNLTTCAIVTLLFISATQAGQDEQKRFQGTWKVIAAEQKGEKVKARDLEGLFLIIDGDAIQVRENGKVQERYTFKLIPDKKPKQITFTYTEGPKKGRTDRGIYRFLGDRLTFCI